MNCVICGEDSAKPICANCTKKIIVENPLVATKTIWVGEGAFRAIKNFEIEDISKLKAYLKLLLYPEIPYITSQDISILNELLKIEKSLDLDDEVYHYLSILLFKMHITKDYYLSPFEIDENYYLNLSKKFIMKGLDINEENRDLYNWALKLGEFEGNKKMIKEYAYKGFKKFGDRIYLQKLLEILIDENNYEKVEELCTEYLKTHEKDYEIIKIMAKAQMNLGKFEDAQITFLKAIELKNDDWESWYLRGISLKNIGKYGGAIQSFQTTIALNPEYKESYKHLVEVLKEMGQDARAKEIEEKYKQKFGEAL